MVKKEEILKEADFIIKENATIRRASLLFRRSKSSIYQDLKITLKKLDLAKWNQVGKIFLKHQKEKHIKGGETTKKKYKSLKRV